MGFTLLSNIPLVVLPPIAPASPALNPAFQPCDPTNGNYFLASGRDLVQFFCTEANDAPAWSGSVTYTAGQVVLAGSPAIPYIAIANASPNLNQNPVSSPSFWSAYSGPSTISVFSAPDACTGRKSDIVNYPIPELGFVQMEIEGSSFFTQVNGQVQFQVSSSLVTVLIQSL